MTTLSAVTTVNRSDPRLAFLAAAGRVLGASLDYRQTLQGLSQLGLGVLGDVCLVGMLDDADHLEIVAGAHIDPAKAAVVRALRGATVAHCSKTAGVVRTGRSCVLPMIDGDLLRNSVDGDAVALFHRLQLGPTVIVPLVVRHRQIGALLFSKRPGAEPYAPDDVALAEELARRAAAAVDNARAFSHTSAVAHTLQHSLLPPRLPAIPGVELAARYQPASRYMDVGGDFYDAFALTDGHWGLLIGDVAGKGPAAAATTAIVRYTARAAARFGSSGGVAAGVNDALLETDDDENFCTMVYADLEPADDGVTLSLLNCGHPAPLLVTAAGEARELECQGSLLGQFPDPLAGAERVRLGPGDVMVFVTDGVLEARAPRPAEEPGPISLFGYDGLTSAVTAAPRDSADGLARAIQEAALDFAGGTLTDDLAVLVVRVPESVNSAVSPSKTVAAMRRTR